ncbi:MAG: OmpH family outer membrane protein [Candidatus Eremiobacteraeota bacterium]|nr:OmpH family outer membrane protein [Candidatus Eremiobacteraeota bacterium]
MILAAAVVAGCGSKTQSSVGLVDVARLTSNWPQYVNYNNQLVSDEQAIGQGRGSNAQKQQQARELQRRYAQIQADLVAKVRAAAAQVAQQKNIKLVVTREFVGFGGVDITPDVEKILGITERATPSP